MLTFEREKKKSYRRILLSSGFVKASVNYEESVSSYQSLLHLNHKKSYICSFFFYLSIGNIANKILFFVDNRAKFVYQYWKENMIEAFLFFYQLC